MATDVTNTTRPPSRGHLRRRIAAWTAIAVGGFVVAAVVFLSVPGVRTRILRDVIARIDARLPGDLTVEHAAWPSPGTIEASGVEWTDSTETLARAARVRVSVRLLPLLRRDIAVERAEVAGAYIDAPAIAATLARTFVTVGDTTRSAKRPFPRDGSVEGTPSIALDNVMVSIDSIRVAERGVLSGIELAGSANLLHGQAPALRIDRFAIDGASGAWGIDSMHVDVDLARGVVDGRARARVSNRWPFVVTLSSDRSDQIVVTAAAREGATPPDSVGARIIVEVVRDGLAVKGVSVTADVRTPTTTELARDPILAPFLAGVPDLEGIAASLTVAMELVPGVVVRTSADLHENSWIRAGHVEAGYRDGAVTNLRATLSLDGLDISASARGVGDSLYADVTADVTSAAWLRTLHPGTTVPDSIRARLDVSARSTRSLRAIRAVVMAEVSDVYAGATVEVEPGEEIVARISPVIVRKTPLGAPPALGGGSDATLRWNSARGDASVKDLHVTSDFGSIRADASMTASRDITYVVGASWPTPPPELLNHLARLDRAQKRALEADWKRDGPFAMRVGGTFNGDAVAPSGRARVTFDLPGPRTLASLLPDSARVSDLGALAGTIDATVRRGATGLAIDADADLSATSWIDTARVSGHLSDGRTRIDSLIVAIASMRVSAEGSVSNDSLSLTAHAVVDDAVFLRRFSPGLPDLRATIDAHAGGTMHTPTLDATLEGTVGDVAVTGNARLGEAGSTLNLHAPGGIRTSQISLDHLDASLSSSRPLPQLFPARVSVHASGPGMDVRQSAMLSIDGGIDANVDTLGVTLDGRGLAIEAPFSVRWDHDGELSVDSLRMSGSLGRARFSGVAGPLRTRFDGAISVEMPSRPASIALPDNLWPDVIDATFRADTLGLFHADVTVKGIVLADGREPTVSAGIDATRGRVDAHVDVSEAGASLADGHATIPGTLVLIPPSMQTGSGDVDITVHANDFPVVLRATNWKRPARVDGTLIVSGPAASPTARIDATAGFPRVPGLEAYRIRVDARTDSSRSSRGMSGTLEVTRGAERVVDAEIDYPLEISVAPPFAAPIDGGVVRIHVGSSDLPLGDLDPFLPSNVGLDGTVAVTFDVVGPVDDPSLDGRVTPKNLEVSVADRMRLVASGDVRIGGTAKKPTARGEIVIENGLIHIAEPPKELLPTSGPSSLTDDVKGAAIDTTASASPARTSTARVQSDVDVTVRIPSGLWIRGQGLDAELAGDLRIRQTAGRPTLTGTLRALRGTLVFLGRSFQLDRGSVTFYGDDENNPTLDIQLSATLDGVTVRVIISGNAAEPEFALESDPEMQEGDIMSYLVFGKPLDTLDQDQVSLVEQRATEIAAAMGAVRLQEGLSRQLGIDMVTIRSGVSTDESSAIVVGKYLNPRLLIKYERLLEEQAAQFISIEYFLTRRLKIDTLYGRQDQQGIEIEWSNEY